MKRKPILHLVNELSDDSSNNLVLGLVQGLDSDIYEHHVGYLRGAAGMMLGCFEVAAHEVKNFRMDGSADISVISKVLRYLRSHQIQLVHTHVLRSDIVGGLASRIARDSILLSTKHNAPYPSGHRLRLLRNFLYWPAMHLPDHIITVSESLRHKIISRAGLNSHRVATIKPGIQVEKYYQPQARGIMRKQLGLQAEDSAITYTGRLVPGKGLEVLLSAARRILDRFEFAHFLIVGQGPLHAKLEDIARESRIDSRVTLTGIRRDIPSILAATDIFVLPSYSEGLPLSLLEAMAAAKPSVATSIGGVPELIDSGLDGIIVPPGNLTALAEALCRLLENEPYRENLGRRAREKAISNFTLERMVSEYESVYRSALQRGQNRVH